MNVADTIWLALLLGALGGVIHGVGVYHGVVWPRTFEANVPIDPDVEDSPTRKMSLWVPGVLGQAGVGAFAAALVLFSTLRPDEVFNPNSDLTNPMAFNDLAILLAAGLGASVVINKYLESRGWDKIIAQEPTSMVTESEEEPAKLTPDAVEGEGAPPTGTEAKTKKKPTVKRVIRRTNPAPVRQAVAGVRPWRYIQALQSSSQK